MRLMGPTRSIEAGRRVATVRDILHESPCHLVLRLLGFGGLVHDFGTGRRDECDWGLGCE